MIDEIIVCGVCNTEPKLVFRNGSRMLACDCSGMGVAELPDDLEQQWGEV